jgi:hypothetical protein
MPSKMDSPNGTALISEKPALAAALKDLASLRKQFLPYFVEGHALGDSVLAQATTAFVRAYGMPGRLLVFVLNVQRETQQVVLRSDLSLWLPRADSFEVNAFDGQGHLLHRSLAHDTRWVAATPPLQPGELAVFEVQAEKLSGPDALPSHEP